MDDFSTAEIVVLVIVFLIKGIIAPMSSFWLGFGLGFFVSDGGGWEVSILHSLGPPLRNDPSIFSWMVFTFVFSSSGTVNSRRGTRGS